VEKNLHSISPKSLKFTLMKIPLNEFELHVKPEPLERGLSLFERGQVESIRNLGKGAVEAVVHDGGAVWHPRLTIQNDVALDSNCACGEAPDNICRHGAALIFALQSGDFPEGITTRTGKPPMEKAPAKGRGRPKLEEDAPKAKKAPAPKKAKPPKTPADILAIVPHDELKAFVLAECQQHKDFAIRLKAHFGDLMPATSPADIKKTDSGNGQGGHYRQGQNEKTQRSTIPRPCYRMAQGSRTFCGKPRIPAFIFSDGESLQ
jgi:hypothetical protein